MDLLIFANKQICSKYDISYWVNMVNTVLTHEYGLHHICSRFAISLHAGVPATRNERRSEAKLVSRRWNACMQANLLSYLLHLYSFVNLNKSIYDSLSALLFIFVLISQQICVKLWCEVPAGSGKCKTGAVPAADGTNCGDNKVNFCLFVCLLLLLLLLFSTFVNKLSVQAQFVRICCFAFALFLFVCLFVF